MRSMPIKTACAANPRDEDAKYNLGGRDEGALKNPAAQIRPRVKNDSEAKVPAVKKGKEDQKQETSGARPTQAPAK